MVLDFASSDGDVCPSGSPEEMRRLMKVLGLPKDVTFPIQVPKTTEERVHVSG